MISNSTVPTHALAVLGVMFFFSTCIAVANATTVPLKPHNGGFLVQGVIDDQMTVDFQLDTGAADVNIPEDAFQALQHRGVIKAGDMLNAAPYLIADGSKHLRQRFVIRSLRLGTVEVKDVIASVSGKTGLFLLGQSFLRRLPSWRIDNEASALIADQSSAVSHSDQPVLPARANRISSKDSADWMSLGSFGGKSEEEALIDVGSVRVEGGYRKVWFKRKFEAHSQPDVVWHTGKMVLATLSDDEVDCRQARVRANQVIFYFDDGTSNRFPPTALPTEWEDASNPESSGTMEKQVVCGTPIPTSGH